MRSVFEGPKSRGSWRGIVRLVVVLGVVLTAAVAFAAVRRGSDACPTVGCVESAAGDFCLCRAGVDVCAGEKEVRSCSARLATGTCCVSAIGCYCTNEPACTFPEDVRTDRCGDTLPTWSTMGGARSFRR